MSNKQIDLIKETMISSEKDYVKASNMYCTWCDEHLDAPTPEGLSTLLTISGIFRSAHEKKTFAENMTTNLIRENILNDTIQDLDLKI